jgi:glutaredoxin
MLCSLKVRPRPNNYKLARQPTFIHLSQRHWQEHSSKSASAKTGLEKQVKEKTQVILYTRPGCHLCEEMKQQMVAANCAELYSLTEVNIETDPELLARYRYEIPVVSINGVEVFRHRLRSEEFKAYLERFSG